MKAPIVDLVCDLQFGSTGKGLLCGYLAEKYEPDTVISAWMPNAGHTYINDAGRTFVHTMLPNGVVSPKLEKVMLGPGSVINLPALLAEVEACTDLLDGVAIFIHHAAAIVQDRHREAEAGPMTKIGSTKKGCGAAIAEKIGRNPDGNITAYNHRHAIDIMFAGLPCEVYVVDNQAEWLYLFQTARRVLVEGAQGYSLGINSGFYPYTTSRECTPAQIMTDCGLPAYIPMNRYGCARTYPIRVANRYDEEGNQIGWSGPHYYDQKEITWEQLGQKTEVTTVTKLPRRVFTFSHNQLRESIQMTGVDHVFLNFVNYLTDDDTLPAIKNTVEEAGASLSYLGYGPAVHDVKEVI